MLNFPPTGHEDTVFVLTPESEDLHFDHAAVGDLFCVWLLVAQLESSWARQPGETFQVDVQLVSCPVWTGRLPSDLTMGAVEQMWFAASQVCQAQPTCRILSGHHVHLPHTSLAEAASQGRLFRRHASGSYLLNIHPACHGGGVKEENAQLAKARTAALLLDKGVPLHTASHTVDALVAKVGSRPLLTALQANDADKKWQAVAQVASDCQVPLPEGNGKTERAGARIQKTFRKRQAAQTHVQADEFALHGAMPWMSSPFKFSINRGRR